MVRHYETVLIDASTNKELRRMPFRMEDYRVGRAIRLHGNLYYITSSRANVVKGDETEKEVDEFYIEQVGPKEQTLLGVELSNDP